MSLITPTLSWVVDSFDLSPSFDVDLWDVGDVVVYDTLRIQYSTDGLNWTDYTAILLTVAELVDQLVTVSAGPLEFGTYLFRARVEQLVATGSPWSVEVLGDWSANVLVTLRDTLPTGQWPSGSPYLNPITTTTLRHRSFPVPSGYPQAFRRPTSPYGHHPSQRLGSTFTSGNPQAHRIGAGTKPPPPRRRK